MPSPVASPARPAARVAGPGAAATGLAQFRTGDPRLEALVARLRRVLDRDIPILVLGETGTGKGLLARAIHRDSARARQPFVAVNCAAGEDPTGSILQANGGTLFLDEIGDLPLPLQAQLLRVLQDRVVTPPGGAAPVPLDLSIIGATQRSLREMIDAGAFREDLYYHLNGLAVQVPPLRERSDLGPLVRRILDADDGARQLQLSPEVKALFEGYGWPGNVRQLFNVLRAAAAMAGSGLRITAEHLPDDFLDDARRCTRANSANSAAAPPAPGPGQSLEAMEVEAIRRAVEAAGGNISEASKRLGVSRNTIYRKLRARQAPAA